MREEEDVGMERKKEGCLSTGAHPEGGRYAGCSAGFSIFRERFCRKRHQSYSKEKNQMNPCEQPDVGTAKVVQLRLLADPKNSEGQETHQVDENCGRE
ncbi:MAG TPA: hypothetical protein VGH37_03220 [Candidatus Acidoferrum sp.]|jgi:hypothetical protein